MLVLGIESSAHTFGVGIVRNGKILANPKAMFKIENKGLIPAEVAETHAVNAAGVVSDALELAGIKMREIQGVGYTRGPGLGPCLQVGELTAKTIAKRLGVAIAQVNHAMAHVEITKKFAKMQDPLVLYVSGGNSQILKKNEKFLHYSVLGETFDIGVGNMLDSFAREIGLNPAWGSTVARLAEGGRYVKLPYKVKGMDFSFTGIATSAAKMKERESVEDLCFSVQETAFSMLCEATERAMLLTRSRELCVCGGVAQSNRLRQMLGLLAKEHKVRFGYAPDQFNADNGAMIAFVAEKMLKRGMESKLSECGIEQRYRIEDAVIA
ncbi:MAG: tRNA (adenosine(37)-N6)-threonylcarbamoyltransferase complex transferase subunit TsaD [Candidatus Micrarchaeota archaeon]|nr:tRNA (adenosine(37)-N6)-threonylcarbamoyltransferase complex transferase subunit TsaD [Candidatus Micrarchaeota archaeon]MDE1847788.1 tRNA (adenosine(37)-N6)-threonylcarbamoyltransferase complex transferase subunit TsaD [Candidatus Micrarchaeota archaeon]MDE1864226.1 tRNA (adenosine(37)-N6)-threonylcarbamoyltransferase complex transferase subunit TsaD [Candidatus Micrarchaeota archaeon]